MVSVYRYIRERLTSTEVLDLCLWPRDMHTVARTEAAFWKDDRLSAADWDDVANKVVSSAYTRSVKDDEPTLMPGLDPCDSRSSQSRRRIGPEPQPVFPTPGKTHKVKHSVYKRHTKHDTVTYVRSVRRVIRKRKICQCSAITITFPMNA